MGLNSAFKGIKQRSQSHSIKISGEAASADIEPTRAFTVEFKKIIGGNDFPPDIKNYVRRSNCVVYERCVA